MNGRKLASFTKDGKTTTFTYDGDGNRIRKVSGNLTIDYIVIGGIIYGEIRTENGFPLSLWQGGEEFAKGNQMKKRSSSFICTKRMLISRRIHTLSTWKKALEG